MKLKPFKGTMGSVKMQFLVVSDFTQFPVETEDGRNLEITVKDPHKDETKSNIYVVEKNTKIDVREKDNKAMPFHGIVDEYSRDHGLLIKFHSQRDHYMLKTSTSSVGVGATIELTVVKP